MKPPGALSESSDGSALVENNLSDESQYPEYLNVLSSFKRLKFQSGGFWGPNVF
ncbi:MAG: hypothetical protein RMM53_12225 [Bacteroidia bacterium]|nr:hypothetical protein [Bacteroidia bacterium]